jgi:sporulation protein YlmC with PRC-barrel domain
MQWNDAIMPVLTIEQDAFNRRTYMQIKHALATTSVLALLLADPVMAQNQPDGSQPAAKSGGADIVVQQPPPTVTVDPKAPNVTVQTPKPEVNVVQPPPQVTVTTPEPKVDVQTSQPDVKVVPSGQPNVTVVPPPGGGVGTTTPTDRGPAAGKAAVAPAAGTFPMTAEAEKFMGKDVYGANGEDVGDLENLLIGPDGRVRAAIVEFGGFLGIGTNKVAVPWDQLQITGDRVVTNLTKEQVRTMPRWEKDRPSGEFAEDKPYR